MQCRGRASAELEHSRELPVAGCAGLRHHIRDVGRGRRGCGRGRDRGGGVWTWVVRYRLALPRWMQQTAQMSGCGGKAANCLKQRHLRSKYNHSK